MIRTFRYNTEEEAQAKTTGEELQEDRKNQVGIFWTLTNKIKYTEKSNKVRPEKYPLDVAFQMHQCES